MAWEAHDVPAVSGIAVVPRVPGVVRVASGPPVLVATVEVSGRRFDVSVIGPAFGPTGPAPVNGAGRAAPKRGERKSGGGGGPDLLTAPLQGNMWKVLVEQGQAVEEGQLLCIIEAMKMENEITAHKAGVIKELSITEGAAINAGDPIALIVAAEPAAE